MSAEYFSDFEPYCDTIANVDLRMRVLGLERPEYSLAQASVGQLQIQWACEGSGQLSEGATIRHGIGLYMQLDPRPMRVNSMPIDPDAIVFFSPGSEFCFSCKHANSWFSVLVPLDVLAPVIGEDPSVLVGGVSVIKPGKQVARQLRTIVPAYLRAISRTPALGGSVAANEEFQNEVLSVARRLFLREPGAVGDEWSISKSVIFRHDRLASDAADLIESISCGSHSVEGIAKRLDVSVRTLSAAFHSRFGMSPRQFIQAMRLNRARKLLIQGAVPRTRVSDIAAECGYWDFGRFASKYRQLFGELPSQTLRS